MRIAIAIALNNFDRITRMWEILHYFENSPHELFIIGSGRAFSVVEEQFPESFGVTYPKNPQSEKEREEIIWLNNQFLSERLRYFKPDVMILDGEEFSARLAYQRRIPIISIDPQHLFQYARFNIAIPPNRFDVLMAEKDKLKNRPFRAKRYLLPTFIESSIRAHNAVVTKPIFRSRAIKELMPTTGDYILVFAWPNIQQELRHFRSIEQIAIAHVPMLRHRKEKERVVWEQKIDGSLGTVRKRRKEQLPQVLSTDELKSKLPESDEYVSYKISDTDGWLSELAASRALLADANPTAIAEAIALQKPMLIIPKADNFQQWCYAQYIENNKI